MDKIRINRAPVLTLWATVVAERLGYKHEEALTLAKALTGTTAQAHGQKLGIYHASDKKTEKKKSKEAKPLKIISQQFLAKKIAVVRTKESVRAVSNEQLIKPESVERYLTSKFGDALPKAHEAMKQLARSFSAEELRVNAYQLYGKFTPQVPSGAKGWGAKGELDLEVIRSLTSKPR